MYPDKMCSSNTLHKCKYLFALDLIKHCAEKHVVYKESSQDKSPSKPGSELATTVVPPGANGSLVAAGLSL